MSGSAAEAPVGLRAALGRVLPGPGDVAERFRWLLTVTSVAYLLLLAVVVATGPEVLWLRIGGSAGVMVLSAWWIWCYRRGPGGLGGSLWIDGVLLVVVGVALGQDQALQLLLVVGLALRSLRGSTRSALAKWALFLGVYVVVDALAPGADGLSIGDLVVLPELALGVALPFAMSAAGTHLDWITARDRLLGEASAGLLTATDRDAVTALVVDIAWKLAVRSCEPGVARAVLTLHQPSGPPIVASAGDGPEPAQNSAIALPLGKRGRLVVSATRPLRDECRLGLETLAAEAALALEGVELTETLRRNAARFSALVQQSSDLVTVVAADGTVTYCSPSIHTLLGLQPADLQGKPFASLVHPDDQERGLALGQLATGQSGSGSLGSWRLLAADGRWVPVETLATNLLNDPDVGGIVLNSRDVSERRLLEDQLLHQAFHDPLTGLANRALFFDRVDHALSRAARHGDTLAVLFFDLDGFRAVNDQLGHALGDDILRAIGDRLRPCLRATDTAARIGGDEFAVLLEDLAEAGDAERTATRLLAAFAEPVTAEGQSVTVEASVGLVVSAGGDAAVDELLRRADLALHTAKSQRTRIVVYDEDLLASVNRRMELEVDLRHAVARDELVLHYQPVLDLQTGQVTGAEALARWNHPRYGLLPPAEFIGIAEETGLIVSIGRWVLEEACRRGRAWHDEGASETPLSMSVNLSPLQLQRAELPGEVAEALAMTGFDPHRLVLEITETALMEQVEAVIPRLQALKALGVRLAVDDFGTGYSSLSYLRDFPIDALKIDRSFVDGLARDHEDTILVHAIIELGRTLGLQTVAEGIEHAIQVPQLRGWGCDLGQGFHFARPLTAADFTTWLNGTTLVALPPAS